MCKNFTSWNPFNIFRYFINKLQCKRQNSDDFSETVFIRVDQVLRKCISRFNVLINLIIFWIKLTSKGFLENHFLICLDWLTFTYFYFRDSLSWEFTLGQAHPRLTIHPLTSFDYVGDFNFLSGPQVGYHVRALHMSPIIEVTKPVYFYNSVAHPWL